MKKLILLPLCALFLCFSGCGEKQHGDALDTYLAVIDSLKSGRVTMTTSAADNTAVIFFRSSQNGEASEIYTEIGDYVTYFDGEGYYAGLKGEPLVSAEQEMEPSVMLRYLIGGPAYATDADSYKPDESGIYRTAGGYRLVIVTRGEGESDALGTTLTATLSAEMMPKKVEIVDRIDNGKLGTETRTITLVFDKIGEDILFEIPEKA